MRMGGLLEVFVVPGQRTTIQARERGKVVGNERDPSTGQARGIQKEAARAVVDDGREAPRGKPVAFGTRLANGPLRAVQCSHPHSLGEPLDGPDIAAAL